MLFIKPAQILTPDQTLSEGGVLVADGRIQAIAVPVPPPDAKIIEIEDSTLLPGFIDLQVNGGFGHDFSRTPDSIWTVAARLPQFGITAFCPTIVTSPLSAIEQAQTILAQRPAGFRGAEPIGLHLEGPFLNPAKKGAHNQDLMRLPDLALCADWTPAQHVKLVTLAPELPGARALIAALSERQIVVSAGHSMATFAEAESGFAAGITYGTHLFNAMSGLHHREPGLVGALLADPRLVIGLIADGVHVHPALVKLAWQAAGPRLNLVSDAIAALGMPPGEYDLGRYRAFVDSTSSRLADGTMAGAILGLDAVVRNLISFTGCSLAEAVSTVTTTPAELLNLHPGRGSLTPGAAADLVLLDNTQQIILTIVKGEIVYDGRRAKK